MKNGYYKLDPNKASFRKDFSEAYTWMENEMHKRGINPTVYHGVADPLVWAWHTWDGRRQVPEYLDETFHIDEKEENPVCLEIEVPNSKVLLGDFNAWHYVLNDIYLDDSNNEEEFDKMCAAYNALPLKEREKKKLASWQRIFDISQYTIGDDWRTNGFYVQATFYGLHKEQIKNVYR